MNYLRYLPAVLMLCSSPSWGAHAIAAAADKNQMYYFWNINQPNLATAEKKALESCEKSVNKKRYLGPCQMISSGVGPRYVAFYHTVDGKGFGVLSDTKKSQALVGAKEQCSSKGAKCGNQPVHVNFDAGEKGKKGQHFASHTLLKGK